MGSLGWPEILIIAAVLLLLFGATRLPNMARSLGRSMRIFKSEMDEMRNDRPARGATSDPAALPQSTVADPVVETPEQAEACRQAQAQAQPQVTQVPVQQPAPQEQARPRDDRQGL